MADELPVLPLALRDEAGELSASDVDKLVEAATGRRADGKLARRPKAVPIVTEPSTPVSNMEFHEAACIFPLDEATLDDLAEDIRRHGQWESIKTFGGKIIDGRRRYLACQKAGVGPRFEEVSPPDPIAYAWSLNGPRRHLTTSQKAMVAARMRELYDRQAKERQRDGGGDKKSAAAKSVVANLPQPMDGNGSEPAPSRTARKARDQAGKAAGVGGRTVDHATMVLTHGDKVAAAIGVSGRRWITPLDPCL